MKKTKDKWLSYKQKEAITEYLEKRLGKYGIKSNRFKWDFTFGKYHAYHKIDLKHTGILKHMLKKCILEISVWDTTYITIDFSYSHCDGGTNGHVTDIVLSVTKDGNVKEV